MAYAKAFQRVEQEFKRLNDQLAAGQITQDQFAAALKELMAQDAQGRYWTIGVRSGKWYVNDGEKWVEATPPQEPEATLASDITSPPPPAWAVAASTSAGSVPAAKPSSRLWLAGLLVLLLFLCLCLCIVLAAAGPIGPILNDLRGFLGYP